MKKIIDFGDNVELIQSLADKKFDGNFSLAVREVMSAVSKNSIEFPCYGEANNNFEPIVSHADSARGVANFIESDLFKIIGLPEGMIHLSLAGAQSMSFASIFKNMLDDKDTENNGRYSNMIFSLPVMHPQHQPIKTAFELASIWLSFPRSRNNGKGVEKSYHVELEDKFDSLLPEYEFVGSEVRTTDMADRIDILAKCKDTNRDVIIELKTGKKSAHKQLRSYAYEFDNPILVNISEEEVINKRDGIKYLTFNEIGLSI